MRGRLSFSIALHARPDVLLVDEALRTGDEQFRAQAREKLKEFAATTGTIVAVSHDLSDLESRADRVLWLEDGHLRADGPAAEIVVAYRRSINSPT